MKNIPIAIAALLVLFLQAALSQAATPATQGAPAASTLPAVRLQTKFEIDNAGKRAQNASEAIVPERSSWVTLASSSEGILVLGKIGNASSETVRVDTIVLDTTAKNNGVISTPSFIVRYGEEARFESTGKSDKIVISLIAKRDTVPAASITR